MRRTRGRLLLAGIVLLVTGISLVAITGTFERSYETNGERIYFTGSNERGQANTFLGAPFVGARAGSLSCASCHGPHGDGGRHRMHMLVMDAPDIRWSTLAGGATVAGEHDDDHGSYDLEAFRLAVVEGRHPDGEPLNDLMPRWQLTGSDLAALADFLRTLD